MKRNSSDAGFTLVEIMIVVVIIGLLAALAIPAFQKIRQSSQDKIVLSNARQLSAAADQYFMEFGRSTVSLGSLVGVTSYVKDFSTVANEVYPRAYTQGDAVTVTGIEGVRTITYSP
ncbi:MAG TPA: prepilin-type N-terminal cleavage/methylation domain-containing protein [Opitutaceae bacterium]|nr:prepilin-type N-terminal cleavage/methylation domain-containing protein [Opitutaceae bacterium]HND63053.1 prepilin-type N-terminal cleavage/methylation domain-containing protein [Opitutaceae bacterium]